MAWFVPSEGSYPLFVHLLSLALDDGLLRHHMFLIMTRLIARRSYVLR